MKIARRDLHVTAGWPETAGAERWRLVLDVQKGHLFVERLRAEGGGASPSRRTLTVAESLDGADGPVPGELQRLLADMLPDITK